MRCARILENPRVNVDDLAPFDFELPPELIAQHPPAERDGGRLMLLDRETGSVEHSEIRALPAQLREGDLLVTNATRVLAARLRGHKASGGSAEALLLGPAELEGRYRALIRHSGRLRAGRKYRLGNPALDAELLSVDADGIGTLAFEPGVDPYTAGETPLPPYIRREAARAEDEIRYQTTFARVPGSIAAPTAGLHLSERLLAELEQRGVERAEVVLHVGLGTFRPLREEDLVNHRLHEEYFELPESTAAAISRARARGGRVVAVGTTATRVLESRATDDRNVRAGAGMTDLFLAPGDRFRAVDALLTNFHLPRSSLLLLVAAFAGRENVLAAYAEAVRERYRFYSYGDAMLIQAG
ncbi:MAG: tRNA preQ1(34) S-adenosylmethionine ribosyltransferase-isomerase QueA [Deltaproteobacteria bacterium]|jgi:S-adenosylmethionine:tRNA ribosyltransferase-isomerase|nr:tRNA preQ1(34) S-adenosylmethionine ribosyltransferase-isomerase QueA [Deltaproteobacteria bacterium]